MNQIRLRLRRTLKVRFQALGSLKSWSYIPRKTRRRYAGAGVDACYSQEVRRLETLSIWRQLSFSVCSAASYPTAFQQRKIDLLPLLSYDLAGWPYVTLIKDFIYWSSGSWQVLNAVFIGVPAPGKFLMLWR
ncbi:hypothetical protein NE237_029329 [Protea cynaroides]|uniref:Uncharacterized protein n=1 Tax=Protea cynaroides TaxID=273540 RepID=A0A9Q0GUH3_9MAGN|nr:hypothetical protein NE237_029029 [Protea cynaroides]KAJ4952497.1 hypothetical protein NE237_029329 [Protea cynaroides]